jgi:osmotically-inducible protein OsmY
MLGVWRVDNRLKVRLNDRNSNAETEKQLKAALSWDAVLDGSRIDVAVINRSAYLSGTLDSSIQKAEAQDVASRTKGVLLVRNHLKIEPESSNVQYDWPYYSYYDWPFFDQPPYSMSSTIGPEPYLSDGQIKKNIEDALLWSPFVDRDDVKVNVHGGVVTLNGTVGTWIGWGEADKDAHKSGAAEVLNQVKVKKGHWW